MRIIILGGTGLLGHKMWQRLSSRFEDVYVTCQECEGRRAVPFTNAGDVRFFKQSVR